ncbi:MAG TPA: hypothetical protein VL574_11265 [Stellaceae bacterium]|nr:hypothetical protein [Stellaceae bacterium]
MSAVSTTPPLPQVARRDLSDTALIRAVDQIPETTGLGIVLIANGVARTIRPTPQGGETAIFEYRPSVLAPRSDHAPMLVRRTGASDPWTEWSNFGLNCGGAALSWIGVIGAAAAAPATGGVSVAVSAAVWAGALASSASCGVSAYRIHDMVYNHSKNNKEMDQSNSYIYSMAGLDFVSIYGAKGAFKEIVETRNVLKRAGVSTQSVWEGKLYRPQRKALTQKFNLVGNKRVPAVLISRVVKVRLLNAIIEAVGLTASSYSGTINDLVVWIAAPGDAW